MLLFCLYKVQGGSSLENNVQLPSNHSNVYDQDWIHLMKQAKYIGLSPSEVRQLLKHLAIEEEKPLVSKISEFVTDPT